MISSSARLDRDRTLRLLGLGAGGVRRIPTDNQGRMRADALAAARPRAARGDSRLIG